MNDNAKKVPFFKRFVGRFLLIAVVPALILEVTIVLIAASSMKSNMKDTGLDGLAEALQL